MDMQVRYEKLLADAAECAQLRDLATDPIKRELFGRLSDHLGTLALLMRRAVLLENDELQEGGLQEGGLQKDGQQEDGLQNDRLQNAGEAQSPPRATPPPPTRIAV